MKNIPLESAIKEVKKELQEFNINMSEKEVEETYRWYMKVIVKFMGIGLKSTRKFNFERLEIPGLGVMILKESLFKSKAYKGTKEEKGWYDYNDGIEAHHSLFHKGWHLLGWTEESGYIFVNRFTEQVYKLNRKILFNNLSAYIYFNKIVDTSFVKNGYEVYLGENIVPLKYIGGAIEVYSRKGKLLREHNTLEEAYKGHYLPKAYILEKLIYNYYNSKVPLRIRNEFWYFKSTGVLIGRFRPVHIRIKDLTVYDLIDAKSDEVVFSRLGNLTDICEYFIAYKYTTICKTGVLRVKIKNNNSLYGFKFRKSSIQLSKYEENGTRWEVTESK